MHRLPRIFFFCLQFNEMVPCIVWPEKYVLSGLSKEILSFSPFSSIDVANDSDCSDVAGDDDAIDVVDVIVDCDWSVGSMAVSGNIAVIAIALWLIVSIWMRAACALSVFALYDILLLAIAVTDFHFFRNMYD